MITQVGGMGSSAAEFTLSTANVLPLNDNLQTDPLPSIAFCGSEPGEMYEESIQ